MDRALLRNALLASCAGFAALSCGGGEAEVSDIDYSWSFEPATGNTCLMVNDPIQGGEVMQYDQNGNQLGDPIPLSGEQTSYFIANSDTFEMGAWVTEPDGDEVLIRKRTDL